MIDFIKNKVWPIVAGFVGATVVMLAFEYTNHFLFQFPEGMDTNNLDQVRAFAETLPWQAYILVMVGWMLGAFIGGIITSKLAKENRLRLCLVLGALLALAGISNYLMLQDNLIFYYITTPLFFVLTYLGFRAVKKN